MPTNTIFDINFTEINESQQGYAQKVIFLKMSTNRDELRRIRNRGCYLNILVSGIKRTDGGNIKFARLLTKCVLYGLTMG